MEIDIPQHLRIEAMQESIDAKRDLNDVQREAIEIQRLRIVELEKFTERVCGDGCHCVAENSGKCWLVDGQQTTAETPLDSPAASQD